MGKKFTDFVNKMDEEAKQNKTSFNPTERIKAYQKLVKSLYTDVDTWLSEEVQSGKIQTGVVPITIREDQLGTYTVDEKWIQIGNARIQLEPIGTLLVGTNARVDVIYGTREVMIIRTGEKVESPYDLISVEIDGEPAKKKKSGGKSVWKYVKGNQRLSYVTLDKDRFEDLIIDIIDGRL